MPDDQVAVLRKTIADLERELGQIAAERDEALTQQSALADILAAISSSHTQLKSVFETIVDRTTQLCDATFACVGLFEGEALRFAAISGVSADSEFFRPERLHPPDGCPYVVPLARAKTTVQTPDLRAEKGYLERDPFYTTAADVGGARTALRVPLLNGSTVLGHLWAFRQEVRPFSEKQIALLQTFADQAVIAIQNARLFREIEDKGRQLEVASHHKSEFLANMSHELRTPLNAIIGFSEVLAERMFGEINEKQAEYIGDILQSGQHLLSLINDILDLSKIEAGRMELELSDFDLPSSIENTLTLVRERALRRGIELGRTVDERLGMVRADERKVKQVLLNLLSNAMKFTPEGGRIDVRAAVRDGLAEISVTDTGVGIAPEDQETVFEEFRQVGTAAKKVEGTGLGLAISRKFVELHGGRIWVESQVGKGSTFAFTFLLQ
jgi:signal transduction histidine kinase